MTSLPESLQHLTTPEKLALINVLWDSIEAQTRPPLSAAKIAELRRRAAEDDADPDNTIPWEEAEKYLRARLEQK